MPHDELLRIDEVLDRVALSKATLYRLVTRGGFPAPIKLGRASAWRASDVAAWVASLSPGRSAA